MLRRIELHNWKTHKDTVLDFSRGTNILIGRMGAGKSSVMDAVAYALFGKYPALQHRHVSVTDIITNRPTQMQEASVKLDFDVDDNSYEIIRNISLDGVAKATLNKNGAYLQSQPQRVTEEIEKVLKTDYDLFTRAVYSEQNRLTYFLELSPSERKKELDELLGLNLFANALENTTALANKINDMAEDASATAKGFDIEKQKQQLDSLKQNLKTLDKEKEQKAHELIDAKARFESVAKELTNGKAQLAKRQELGKELAELRSKAATLQKEIDRIKEQIHESKEEIDRKIEQQKSIVEKCKKEYMEEAEKEKLAISELASASAEMKQLEKDAKQFESISEELKQKGTSKSVKELVEKKKIELNEIMAKKASLSAAKNDNEKWIEELKRHVAKCPVCERELTDEMINMLIKSKSKAIEEAKSALDKISKQEQDVQKEINEKESLASELALLEKQAQELGNAEEKLGSTAKRAKELEAKRKAAEERAEAKNKELTKANETFSKLEQLAIELERKERYEAELEAAKAETSAKQRELEGISVDETQVDALQKKHTEASSTLSAISASLESYERLIADSEKQISEKQ
ncbi:MAG: AAA family ATPase, partial [Candidatus Micrarchaeaceae archaeon]